MKKPTTPIRATRPTSPARSKPSAHVRTNVPMNVPVLMAANGLTSLGDLQHALADAADLGFRDNIRPASGTRARRSGHWVAEQICLPGVWTKKFERYLKVCFLAGFEFANILALRKAAVRKK